MKRILFFALIVALTGPVLAGASTTTSVEIGSRKVVTFKQDLNQEEIEQVIEQTGAIEIAEVDDNEDVTAVVATNDQIDDLKSRGVIESVDEDVQLEIQSSRVRYPQEVEWNMDQVAAPLAWREGNKGKGVRVAIIDSGIDIDHPDLMAGIKSGINTIRSNSDYDDDNGHGTHVAGIIGARDNIVGVVGVAPEVDLYIAKALDRRGRGYLSDIIEAIDWSISKNVDVINLSLGTTQNLPPLEQAIKRATDAGIVVVAAAGNTGGSVNYPAAYSGVISVGMTDDDNEIHRQSSRGNNLSLVAPGVRINSSYKRGKYRRASGTSMASPHVAGAAALYLASPACNPGCSSSQVKAKIQSTATDIYSPGRDNQSGYGLLNVKSLLSL